MVEPRVAAAALGDGERWLAVATHPWQPVGANSLLPSFCLVAFSMIPLFHLLKWVDKLYLIYYHVGRSPDYVVVLSHKYIF